MTGKVIKLPVRRGGEEEVTLQLVLVTWKDIISTAGWEEGEEVNCPTLVTIGWLHSDDGEQIKIGNTIELSNEMGEAGKTYGFTCLPKGCVVELEYL